MANSFSRKSAVFAFLVLAFAPTLCKAQADYAKVIIKNSLVLAGGLGSAKAIAQRYPAFNLEHGIEFRCYNKVHGISGEC